MPGDDGFTRLLRAGCLFVWLFPWLARPYAAARLAAVVEPGFFGGVGASFFGLAAFGVVAALVAAAWKRLKSRPLVVGLGPLPAVLAAVCCGVAAFSLDRLIFSGTIQDLTVTGLKSGPLGSNEVGGAGGRLVVGCIAFQAVALIAAIRLLTIAVTWRARGSSA